MLEIHILGFWFGLLGSCQDLNVLLLLEDIISRSIVKTSLCVLCVFALQGWTTMTYV